MIFYELVIKCEEEQMPETTGFIEDDPIQEKIENQIRIFNERHFSSKFDRDSSFIYYYAENKMYVAIMHQVDGTSVTERAEDITDEIRRIDGIVCAEMDYVKEITVHRMMTLFEELDGNSLFPFRPGNRAGRRMWDFVNCFGAEIEEMMIGDEELSADDAEKTLDALMADKSLREEIDRIYEENNKREFFGYPVHYKITAGNRGAAKDIAKFMVRALYANNRIPGRRLTVISEFDMNRRSNDMDKWFQNSSGTAVMIELQNGEDTGQFATDLTRLAIVISNIIKEYHRDTLFFLYQNSEIEGFGNETITRLENSIDLIELKEGRGKLDEAQAYMERIIGESRYKDLMDDTAFSYLKKKRSFHASDVRDAVDEWERMCLKEKAYVSYSKCIKHKRKKKRADKKDAYEELQKMIGLDQVKSVIDDLLAYYKIQKERDRYTKSNAGISRHMVFTGNPGCAKTTVARLLADVMLEEGILTSGRFVECGRADLVGKYVGWTAKIVKEKFREASGGILFIDEAYSLVEDHRTFGDEAINTIVQEMENHREDVIVIFAGYPDPMKEFINRNVGLKSRIAFHIDFPDYNEDEMMQILFLMVEERGFNMDATGEEKCRNIFREAVTREYFGNGRYARNLLEHAIMRQAGRLAGKGIKKEYSKERITQLVADDFEDDFMPDTNVNRKLRIGFGT